MSIFENENDVIDNAIESAKSLGHSGPNKVKKNVFMAKSNCKVCLGRGVKIMSFPGNFGYTDRHKVKCHCVVEKEVEVYEK